ncbi:hypothetical protein PM082_012358 [Marasmius tenuissimus]|nr:hypothetical protein PM082_012358 [Marasmius tenuissimus]
MFAEVWERIGLSLRPIETRDLPTPSDITEEISLDKSVSRLIVAPDNVSVTQGDFENLREEILQMMYQVRREIQQRPSNFYDQDPIFAGDKAIYLSFGLTPLRPSESLYSAGSPEVFEAFSRLSAVGFDPFLMTPDQMDARRDVFRCTSRGCSHSFEGSWREWLTHVYYEHEDGLEGEHNPNWTDIAFELVHGRQDTESFGWSCNHCHEVSSEAVSTVMEHLNREHGIPAPQIPDDFFVEDPLAHLDRFES